MGLWRKIGLSGVMAMIVGLAAAAFSVEALPAPVHIAVNASTGQVVITGALPLAEGGEQVAIMVTHPSGRWDYIGQTSTGADGTYTFSYTLADRVTEGIYKIHIGSSRSANSAEAEFVYSAPNPVPAADLPWISSPSEESNIDFRPVEAAIQTGSISQIQAVVDKLMEGLSLMNARDIQLNRAASRLQAEVGEPAAAAKIREIDETAARLEKMLVEAGIEPKEVFISRQIRLVLSGEDAETVAAVFSASSLEGMGKRGLELVIVMEGAVIKLLPQAIATRLNRPLPSGAQIELVRRMVQGDEEHKYLEAIRHSNSPGSRLTPAGHLVELQLLLVNGRQRSEIGPLDSGIVVQFPYSGAAGADEAKLGVYRYQPQTGEWEYGGGRAEDSSGSLTVPTNRFGLYGIMQYDRVFSDLETSWARSAVEQLASRHIIEGYDDHSFRPEQLLTRAEFAALLVKTLQLEPEAVSGSSFTDVAPGAWFAPSVETAWRKGLIEGKNGAFRPLDGITREEMAVLVMKAYYAAGGAGPGAGEPFKTFRDMGEFSNWSVHFIRDAASLGIVTGVAPDEFLPSGYATRASAAMILSRMLGKL